MCSALLFQEIFGSRDSRLLAISLKHFVRSKLMGTSFSRSRSGQEHRRRVENLTPGSQRQWGTMEVDQMLHHLNLACGGSQGFYELPDESYLISRTLFKWILVDWYPEQRLACASQRASKFRMRRDSTSPTKRLNS